MAPFIAGGPFTITESGKSFIIVDETGSQGVVSFDNTDPSHLDVEKRRPGDA